MTAVAVWLCGLAVAVVSSLVLAGGGASAGTHGGRIVFVRLVGQHFELFTIRPDRTGFVRLTHDNADDESPGWSPNGRRLLALADGRLVVRSSEGRILRRLRVLAGQPRWSPNGRLIAYLVTRCPDPTGKTDDTCADLWVIRPDGTGRRRLAAEDADPGAVGRPFSWAPDGRRLVYVKVGAPGGLVIVNVRRPQADPARYADDALDRPELVTGRPLDRLQPSARPLPGLGSLPRRAGRHEAPPDRTRPPHLPGHLGSRRESDRIPPCPGAGRRGPLGGRGRGTRRVTPASAGGNDRGIGAPLVARLVTRALEHLLPPPDDRACGGPGPAVPGDDGRDARLGVTKPRAAPRAAGVGQGVRFRATNKEALMALARVVTFEGVDKARMEEMQREMSGQERPDNIPATEIIVLHDPEADQAVAIVFFENEDDYRRGDEALNAMPAADTPGRRTSVKKYDVPIRMSD
jgi:WD40-like Beta Propeller Repeat